MKRFGLACARLVRSTNPLSNIHNMLFQSSQRNVSSSLIRCCSSNTDTRIATPVSSKINSEIGYNNHKSEFSENGLEGSEEPPLDFIDDRPHPTIFRAKSIDKYGAAYGTGRRKTAVARVWIKQGVGQFIVNRQNFAEYFQSGARMHALEPFMATDTAGLFDVWCTVKGGGRMGQAGAVRHGIARAIEAFEPLFKPILKRHKLLTRDSRMVERKKAGFKKARKRKQWVKR